MSTSVSQFSESGKLAALTLIIEKSSELLASVGVEIADDFMQEQLKEKGFEVDTTTDMVRIPVPLQKKLLSKVPKTVKLYYRNSEKYVEIGGGKTHFTTSGYGSSVLDLNTEERRASVSEDIETFVTAQNYLDNVDIAGPLVTATELSESKADLTGFYKLLTCTDKPFMYKTVDEKNISSIVDMASVVADGIENLRAKPNFCMIFTPTSPLMYTPKTVNSMLKLASYGIPVVPLTMTMGGATAPVTILGQIMQTNAEIIAGIMIVQAFYPGHPTLYGNASSVMDMKTSVLALGVPERPLVNEVCSLAAKHYGIPNITSGLSTDSKSFDIQCGVEKVLTLMPLMGNVGMVFGMGAMDSANTYSLTQLIIDNEIAGAVRHYYEFCYGDNLDEEMGILQRYGTKAEFLKEKHTFKRARNYWRTELFTRDSFSKWKNKEGSQENPASSKAKELATKHAPDICPDTAALLKEMYEKFMESSIDN